VSRGPGHIERAILRAIERNKVGFDGKSKPLRLTSWQVIWDCYPEARQTTWERPPATMAQQKAISRALHSIVRKHPQYALIGGNGRKRLCLYEPADPLSALWAKLTVERHAFVSLSDAEATARSLERGGNKLEDVLGNEREKNEIQPILKAG
jgi:hypothetical protein